MGGLVHGLQVVHGARDRAVLHLSVDDGTVAVDGVGVELDPEVGGPDGRQLGRGDRHRRLWGGMGVGEESLSCRHGLRNHLDLSPGSSCTKIHTTLNPLNTVEITGNVLMG